MFDILAKYVEDKICSYGTDAIMGILSTTPLGAALSAMNSFSEIIDTGGTNIIDELGSHELRHFEHKLNGMPLLKKLQGIINGPVHLSKDQQATWAKSRQEWLANSWQHDWRSQPRNVIGEWIPGRLDYPVVGAPRIGKGKAKSSRQKRRINRYRRYGRMAARSYKWDS